MSRIQQQEQQQDDPFILVSRKKNRNTKWKHKVTNCAKNGSANAYHMRMKRCSLQQLLHIKDWMEVKEIAIDFLNILRSETGSEVFNEIVVYGIGPFMSCEAGRLQLALIHHIRNQMDLLIKTFVFDPVLNDEDYEILDKHLNMLRILQNESCKRMATSLTLFFMPHCDKSLYNNLLSVNWNNNLRNLVVLGNSFQKMVDSEPSRLIKSEYPLLFESVESSMVREVRLTPASSHDALNDLSLHTFCASWLRVSITNALHPWSGMRERESVYKCYSCADVIRAQRFSRFLIERESERVMMWGKTLEHCMWCDASVRCSKCCHEQLKGKSYATRDSLHTQHTQSERNWKRVLRLPSVSQSVAEQQEEERRVFLFPLLLLIPSFVRSVVFPENKINSPTSSVKNDF